MLAVKLLKFRSQAGETCVFVSETMDVGFSFIYLFIHLLKNVLTWPIKFIKHIYIYSQILSYLSIKIDIYNFRIFIQRHFFGGGRIGSIVRWRKSCFFAWLILNKMSNIVSQRPYPGRLVWNTLHHHQASLWRGLSYREHAAKSQSLQFCDGNKLTQTRMPYLKVLLPQHTITTLHTIQTTTLVQ